MLGRVRESTGYGNCPCKGDVTAPVKLSRFSNLAVHSEIGFLEVLGIYGEHRVLKDFGVGRLNGLSEFWKSLTFGPQVADIAQADVAIRLNNHSLIKLWCM